ncbi:MAG: maleylpyruvate isomerase family mycothiol-dependent enzyme [Actinomycetota bacterium]|nr:maleylpyruvate isomerase family mycothiol-dependent enzyme [Actinomycetota bacterium]
MLTLTDFQSAITQYSQQFSEVLRSSDLSAPVPSCPAWTMADLTQHLSGTQRWSTAIVRSGVRGEHPVGPSDRPGLEQWFDQGATELVAALQEVDPQQPAWNFGPEPRLASFWSRRQAHEVAVHLWDAMHAQGQDFRIDPQLAADGLDEVCTVFLYMKLRHSSLPDWAPIVRLEPSDVPDSAVEIRPSQIDSATTPHAIVRGPAHDLLLAVRGRAGLGQIQIQGDVGLVEALLAQGITP